MCDEKSRELMNNPITPNITNDSYFLQLLLNHVIRAEHYTLSTLDGRVFLHLNEKRVTLHIPYNSLPSAYLKLSYFCASTVSMQIWKNTEAVW